MVVEWADRLAPGELEENLSISISTTDDLIRTFTLFFYGRKKTNLINLLKKTFEMRKR